MNNQNVIDLKQKLASLETQENKINLEVQSKKGSRTTGIVITFIGLIIGSGIWSKYNDLGGFLILVGTPIGLIVWISSAVSLGKKNRELTAIQSEISKIKL